MKAIYIENHGSIENLKYSNIKDPVLKKEQVLVEVKAASINHLDIWVRKGLPNMKVPLPLILGSDASGVIIEIGKEGKRKGYNLGDEVVIQPGTWLSEEFKQKIDLSENFLSSYGILGETQNGVQSEYVALNINNIYPKPKHLSFEESASMQLVFMTAYQMLIERAQINKKRKEKVLIYGATSGVGSAAIQIAKYFGATIYATVGNNSKIEYAKKMGADFIYNHNEKDWLLAAKEELKNDKIDIVFEHTGSDTWSNSLRLLSKGGRIVTCGATTGANVKINLAHLFMKQQSILGSTMSSYSSFLGVMKLIENKALFPFVDRVYKFSDIKSAHKRIEERKQFGKVVLVP